MSGMRYFVLALLIGSVAGPLQAQSRWAGDAAVGLLTTSGNSESSTLNAKFELLYRRGLFRNTFSASAINGEQEGLRTAERYTVSDKLEADFTERDYFFLAADYEKDLFGGVRERTSEALGYGRRILLGPVHKLDADLGVGARQTEAQFTGERQSEVIGRGSIKYAWKISETSNFSQAVKVESGESNTFTESVTELKLSVIGNVFAGISFTARNNSDVPAGTKETDTFTAINLSYSFGEK
jgi:putative salt-induced outer membrane protein